jgi:hypothetical protein
MSSSSLFVAIDVSKVILDAPALPGGGITYSPPVTNKTVTLLGKGRVRERPSNVTLSHRIREGAECKCVNLET